MIPILLFIPFISWSNSQIDSQSLFKQVVERRAEMEELAREVKSLQDSIALKTQQADSLLADTETQVQNLMIKKEQLIQKKKHLNSNFENTLKSSADSEKLAIQWISVLKKEINSSIPVNLNERNNKLNEIEKRLIKGEPALSIFWSLWALSSEEISLTKGIKYLLQKDNTDGSEVETIHLGMWKMYERNGAQYSLTEKINNQISKRDLISKADQKEVDKLIEAVKSKSFQKVFSLPQGDLQ